VQWAVMDDGPTAEGTASMKVPCMVQWAVMDDAGRVEGDCALKGGWSRGSQPVLLRLQQQHNAPHQQGGISRLADTCWGVLM
jgi:hypothetical protein